MVAIKYVPIAATACLSLCTGVGASVLTKRQVTLPLAVPAPGLLASSPSAYGGRASSHRAAAADAPSASPANTFGLEGNVPGGLVASQGGRTVATVPAADVGLVPSRLDLSVLGDVNDNLSSLLSSLTSIAPPATQVPGAAPVAVPVAVPVPVPVPGVPSTDPVSALLGQSLGAIQAVLPFLGQLPTNSTVPPSASDSLTALVGSLTALTSGSPGLLGLPGGGIPSASGSLDTLGDVIALTLALVPVLTSLVSVLQLGGQ